MILESKIFPLTPYVFNLLCMLLHRTLFISNTFYENLLSPSSLFKRVLLCKVTNILKPFWIKSIKQFCYRIIICYFVIQNYQTIFYSKSFKLFKSFKQFFIQNLLNKIFIKIDTLIKIKNFFFFKVLLGTILKVFLVRFWKGRN